MFNANLYRKVDGAFTFAKPFDLPVNLMPLETGQDEFLAPNRGLAARWGLLKRVDFSDPKIDQKNFRQDLALNR